MTLLPRGLKVHLASGYTDIGKGIDGLQCWFNACCGRIPYLAICSWSRGRRANLTKIVFWDRTGVCLFTSGSNRACSRGRRTSTGRD
jgi:transposase